MEIDKVKSVITSLFLFISSGSFCSFLIVTMYLAIDFLFKEHNLIAALVTVGIYIPMFLFMFLYSLDYTVRFAARCKISIIEYVEDTTKNIAPTPTSVEMVDYNHEDNKLLTIAALVAASVVSWTLSFMLLIICIGGIDQDLVGSWHNSDQLVMVWGVSLVLLYGLLLVCDIVMFSLAVLVSVSCICSIIKYCRGTKVPLIPTSVESDQP